jgi:hypothetical protein
MAFDKPKLVTYYACPFCSTRIEKEETELGCLNYFGYLRERDKGEPIPSECIECKRIIECMLSPVSSKDAVKEIRKWYK